MITAGQAARILENNTRFNLSILDTVANTVLSHFHHRGLNPSTLSQATEFILEEFSITHKKLMDTHKKRFRAEDELHLMEGSKNPSQANLDAKRKQVAELRKEYNSDYAAFLDARRWEEFSRCLPEAYRSGEPADVVDVARFALLTAAWSPNVKEIVEAAEKIKSLLTE